MNKGIAWTVLSCIAFMAIILSLFISSMNTTRELTEQEYKDLGAYFINPPRQLSGFQMINDQNKNFDIVDFKFKPKPNPESLKLMCDKYEIPANKETVYIEDICKNLSSYTAKDMIKVWFMNEEPINDLDKYKDIIDYKINNLALFLKKIRLLKEA